MNNSLYINMAVTNLKKNGKTYVPYILTCIGTIIMFYNACALTYHTVMHGSVQQMMIIGTFVTGIFSAVFLFYTNSFLVKRRKKEFGLLNILGLEKKHIAKVMLWENVIVAMFSILLGLSLGILFSKLITLILYKLLRFNPNFAFEINLNAAFITFALFMLIFILIFLNNIRLVHLSQPIELLKGGNMGEREPKTKWFTAMIGIITIGVGYGIALIIQKPLAAINMFFLAAILVIIGTYYLFTAGSIALLKILKKNKKYYYNTGHFTTISGMLYRMKQNAIGLSNICIMSTAVIIMISTTISMYVGMEDVLKYRFPKDFSLSVKYTPENELNYKELSDNVNAILQENNIGISNYNEYNSLMVICLIEENRYVPNTKDSLENLLIVMTTEDYKKLTGIDLLLTDNAVAIYPQKDISTISVFDHNFIVAEQLEGNSFNYDSESQLVNTEYLVVSGKEKLYDIYYTQKQLYGDRTSSLFYELSFDLDTTEEEKALNTTMLIDKIKKYMPNAHFNFQSKQLSREEFYYLYGGLFFLGIFLGTLFLMATTLIIYYKQVVEGFEDKERFYIMQKVGMSKNEVKRSINSQILTVFSLPIIAATVHIIVAFPILTKLLQLLNLTNVPLFAICTALTVIAFIIIYVFVYKLTSKAYYKIVCR